MIGGASPLVTVSVFSSTPLPSISTPCGVELGFAKSTVTLPALAVASFWSNFSEPSAGARRT